MTTASTPALVGFTDPNPEPVYFDLLGETVWAHIDTLAAGVEFAATTPPNPFTLEDYLDTSPGGFAELRSVLADDSGRAAAFIAEATQVLSWPMVGRNAERAASGRFSTAVGTEAFRTGEEAYVLLVLAARDSGDELLAEAQRLVSPMSALQRFALLGVLAATSADFVRYVPKAKRR